MARKYAKLRGRIAEKFGSQVEFATVLKVSNVTVSARLNGRTQFTIAEVKAWCGLLDIDNEDVYDYFFMP